MVLTNIIVGDKVCTDLNKVILEKVESLQKWGQENNNPVPWLWNQYQISSCAVSPPAAHLRQMTYQALAGGADLHCGSLLHQSSSWNNIR